MAALSTPTRTSRPRGVIAAIVLALGLACASGSKGQDGSYGVYEEGDDDGDTEATTGVGGDGKPDDPDDDGGESDEPPPDLGACEDDVDCIPEPGTCWGAGQCVGGQCQLAPLAAGEPCDDGDACSDPDLCDGAGNCIGDSIPCTAPHASGGQCVAGACEGLVCDAGFGNCNGEWDDGCELELTSLDHCGACDTPCPAGAHASADCSTGTCQQSCDAPWSNCDDDWANGCEIPEGVPNQCDAGGLNSDNGCWTAWCGTSNLATAVNFGTWHCMECSTCHVPSGGQCQWCSHDTGTWYPAETCVCGNWEDLVCS